MKRIIIGGTDKEIIILMSEAESEHFSEGLMEYERSMETVPDFVHEFEDISIPASLSVGALIERILAGAEI